MPAPVPVPEDLLDPDCPPLKLEVACRSCGRKSKEQVDWAMVDPQAQQANENTDDGIILGRIITCKRCGAVDDYALTLMSRLHLLTNIGFDGPFRGRILASKMRLWDGTEGLRPSHAIAHLRALCDGMPESAEAQRRLGNTCARFGLQDDAVLAWRRALALDTDEFFAALSLAEHAYTRGDPGELLHDLQNALKAWPPAMRKDREGVVDHAPSLAHLLLSADRKFADELCLAAVWQGESVAGQVVVHASVASLMEVEEPSRLAVFLAHGDVIGLELRPGPVEDQPSQLQRLLSGGPRPRLERSRLPVRVAPQPGRNAPCSCGSGKKFKRCCGA